MLGVREIIFYLLLLDSVMANLAAWFFSKEYKEKFKWFAKRFPASKGWCIWYLILVLWIGYLVYF